MLADFTQRYATASSWVSYHRRQHKRLMFRAFFSYGISAGLLLMMLYFAGNNYPIPISIPLLQGGLFIYGSVMLGLGFRMLSGPIANAETVKFESWCALDSLGFLPVNKRNLDITE